MKTIKAQDYNIYIGEIFDPLNNFVRKDKYKDSKLFVLADENTLEKCLPLLVLNADKFKDAEVLEIESGEAGKNLEVCTQLWNVLSDYKADRKILFVNLGGGVIGDMGGFVASAYKRGVDYVNIPTTLLAQVDASVGGKVGVDLGTLKNQVGLFANPQAVFVYPGFLETLDKRQVLSGFAEMLKHALIADKNYWNALKETDIRNTTWKSIISHSINIKNEIVKQDPHEQRLRKILNFGHTIGHAIESSFMFKEEHLLHGEAVAIGMICEAFLSRQKSCLSQEELDDISGHLKSRYQKIKIKDYHRLIEFMRNDKKNSKDEISFTLLNGIGNAIPDISCTADEIVDALNYYQAV